MTALQFVCFFHELHQKTEGKKMPIILLNSQNYETLLENLITDRLQIQASHRSAQSDFFSVFHAERSMTQTVKPAKLNPTRLVGLGVCLTCTLMR